MGNQLRVLIQAECSPKTVRWQTFDNEERLEVREIAIRERIRIPAREISPYRHALLLDGCSYSILNVIRQH